MASFTIPEINFLFEAARMISKSKFLKGTNSRKFRALFAVSNNTCNIVWGKIHDSYRYLQPKHLLWALLFLKCYATEHVNSIISNSDCKSFRVWTWRVIKLLSALQFVSITHSNLSNNYMYELFEV